MLSSVEHGKSFITSGPGLEVIKLEYSLRLKMNSSFITSRPGLMFWIQTVWPSNGDPFQFF